MITSKKVFSRKNIFFSKADLESPRSRNIPTKTQIIKIFQNSFKQKPLQIEKMGRSALHNNSFRVKAGDRNYILKVSLLRSFNESGFLVEELISQTLKKKNLPSVHIHLADNSRSMVPFDFQISDYIQGKSLHDLSIIASPEPCILKAGGEGEERLKLPTLNLIKEKLLVNFRKPQTISPRKFIKKDITLYISGLGSALARIHSVKTSGFGPIDPVAGQNKLKGIHQKWPNYFFKNLQKHLMFLKTAKVISSKDHKVITKIFDKYKNKIICKTPSLLHSDVANHNAIYSSGKIILVDWEDAISGDPLYDIAFYVTGVYENGEWIDTFLEGYKKVNKSPVNFDLLFWLYFLRISLFKAIIRYRTLPSRKDLPDYKERITFAIDKIQKGNYTT